MHGIFVNSVFLFSAGEDRTIRQWDIMTGQWVRSYSGHSGVVYSVSEASGFLFSGSGDKTIRKWDLSTGQLVQTYTGHTGSVSSIFVNSGFLFSGSVDATIRQWDAGLPAQTTSTPLNSVLSTSASSSLPQTTRLTTTSMLTSTSTTSSLIMTTLLPSTSTTRLSTTLTRLSTSSSSTSVPSTSTTRLSTTLTSLSTHISITTLTTLSTDPSSIFLAITTTTLTSLSANTASTLGVTSTNTSSTGVLTPIMTLSTSSVLTNLSSTSLSTPTSSLGITSTSKINSSNPDTTPVDPEITGTQINQSTVLTTSSSQAHVEQPFDLALTVSDLAQSVSYAVSSMSPSLVTDQLTAQSSISLIYATAGAAVAFVFTLFGILLVYRKRKKESLLTFSTMTTMKDAGATTIITANELSIPAFLLKEFEVDFVIHNLLAQGGGGKIYSCHAIDQEIKSRSNNSMLVCKLVSDNAVASMSEKHQRAFFQGLSLMWRFKDHPNFVKVYAFSEKQAAIVLQFYPQGDLEKFIHSPLNSYGKCMVVNLFTVICRAVNHMHEAEFAHCDLKPANILLQLSPSNILIPVISDFGIC